LTRSKKPFLTGKRLTLFLSHDILKTAKKHLTKF